jgi:hypothetical protein
MKFKSEKLSSKIALILITIVLTRLISPLIDRTVSVIIDKIINKNTIKYKIKSDLITSKSNIEKIITKEFNEKQVDFSFDDNFLNTYHLTIIEIQNNRNNINDNIIINLNFNDSCVKIISILGKLTIPYQREEYLEFKKPPLIFGFDSDTIAFKVFWNADKRNLGTMLYRSLSANVGFGQRSNNILNTRCVFNDTILKGQKYFYSAVAISNSGVESYLSKEMPVPMDLYNLYKFKNTFIMELKNENNSFNPDSLDYYKIKIDSILKLGRNIVIDIDKQLFNQLFDKYKFKTSKIYFNEDLTFMNGKNRIQISDLPSNSKYRIYIISKSIKEIDFKKISLKILNKNQIKLKRDITKLVSDSLNDVDSKLIYFNYNYDYWEMNEMIRKKEQLTPLKTKIIKTDKSIIICWTIPPNISFKFVRIFKREFKKNENELNWGEEILRGIGKNDTIYSKYRNYGIVEPPVEVVKIHQNDPFMPPPLTKPEPPMPPMDIKIYYYDYKILNYDYETRQLMPYYIDNDVEKGKIYIYTLIAYNDKDEYSLLIESKIKYDTKMLFDDVIIRN